MSILFVHPNASKKIYQDLSKEYSAIETPIWCGLLANGVRKKGHKVEILDCEAHRLTTEDASEIIVNKKPRLVVIVVYGQQPSASTQNMTGASELINKIKEKNEELEIMLVGLHPSALPEETMIKEKCDYLAEGEGLYTILGFLEGNENVPGLWSRQNGFIIKPEIKAEKVPQELLEEELPGIAWDLLPIDKYRTSNWHAFSNNNDRSKFASIYTSLGCPFKCSFCCINTPFGGSSFRYWSPEFTVNELGKLHNMGIKNIKFADELFVLKEDHFMRICELIIERGYEFNIWAYARIDTVKEKYLKTLKKAGVNWLALGIESGVKSVRTDVIKGKFEDVNIKNIVEKIRSHGINTIGNFIFGLPEDTMETMHETLNLAKDLNCEMVNFYSCMAYPGSQLYKTTKHEDLPKSYEGYSQHSYECTPLPTKYISAKQVLKFRDYAFMDYFTEPRYLDYIEEKFGKKTVNDLRNMKSVKLNRYLLE